MIVVAGSMNYDIILKVKRMPREGETMTCESASTAAGGKGANQAVQSAKLGVKTFMIGAVGNDNMGEYLLSEAAKYGLDVSHVKKSSVSSGMGCIHALEDGRVFATINRGANYDITAEDIERADDLFRQSKILILQNEIPDEINILSAKKAKSYGLKVLYNAAPSFPERRDVLPLADVVIVNEVEASEYLGVKIVSVDDAVREGLKVSGEMRNTWVITMGSQGSVICSGGKSEIVRPYHVDAIETTGAGDSYIGGLGYALINGMDIFTAAKFATKCSAVTVCGIGAQNSMPTLAKIHEMFGED
ncbi:MAG: ribokinase [Synergistaceae bacterium]|nr:ribokinase [Synergistaceae bacterium]MBR0278729.1 ribokinase [Synergistaceae bacterium]